MNAYKVAMEISGPAAMWTRPDTGDSPVTYPAPTFAAVKGIFEAILWSQWAEIRPVKVEICKPLEYHTYTTNYGGPLRKPRNIRGDNNYQLLATVLTDVSYRIYAVPEDKPSNYDKHGRGNKQQKGTTNGPHAYKAIFKRRLERGQCFYTPFLGWKEFTPTYWGPPRPGTSVYEELNLAIPSMLRTCFPDGKDSDWNPVYDQNVMIQNGVLEYA